MANPNKKVEPCDANVEEFNLNVHLNNLYVDDNTNNSLRSSVNDCNYYDIDNIKSLMNEDQHIENKTYKTLHVNIQSLSARFESQKCILAHMQESNLDLDCILLCETFLHENNSHLFHLPGYHFICKNRKDKTRGGVGMYIKENIQFNISEDLSVFIEGEFESIFIDTINESFTTIVGEIYRIPNTSTATYLDIYETILCKLMNNDNVIIGTGQNIDCMHIDTYPPSAEFFM